MALFKADIQKFVGPEYWTNVYYIEAADIDAAADYMDTLKDVEQDTHSQEVTIDKGRVSPVPNPGNAFVTHTYNESGAYINSSPLMPLFVTARIDMNVAAGRPSRKFLRGVLHTDAIDADGYLVAGVQSHLETNYVTPLEGYGWLVDESGNDITGFTIFGKPSDRQLRRGSKRRTTPVIP